MNHCPVSTLGRGSVALITEDLWQRCLQDKGCSQEELPSQHYLRNKIISIGPNDKKLFYYHLTAIAVDLLKIMKEDKELGKGWDKVPKNSTQVKEKTVERLINLRKQTEDGAYNLKQAYFIQILETVWGNKAVDATPHYNDRLRLFGILLT